jgi:hypothetical protein
VASGHDQGSAGQGREGVEQPPPLHGAELVDGIDPDQDLLVRVEVGERAGDDLIEPGLNGP